MSDKKPVAVVSRTIHGRDVLIEVFREAGEFRGRWTCQSPPLSGGSSKYSDSIEKAVLLNEVNAHAGIGANFSS